MGADGESLGMHGFGASAPAKDLYAHFGLTAENVAGAGQARGRAPRSGGTELGLRERTSDDTGG